MFQIEFSIWFKQRIRWNLGGIQTIIKYRKELFNGKTMLGNFILPFFLFSWVLALFGFGVLIYRLSDYLIAKYFTTYYSIQTQTSLITVNDFSLLPNLLLFFGVFLLVLSIFYALFAIFNLKEKNYKRPGILIFMLYEFIYLLLYPVLLIKSMWNLLRGKKKWM